MSLACPRQSPWLGLLLVIGSCGAAAGCGRAEQAQPGPDTTSRPPLAADKAKNQTNPAAGNTPTAQENTLKYYLVSVNKAKTILDQLKSADDVEDAVFKLQKEGDNVKALIKQLDREGPPPQALTQYAAELTASARSVREAMDPRNLPENLPKEKREALRDAARRFTDLMAQFNRIVNKHKVTEGGP